MLWLSPFASVDYRQQDENSWQATQFRALEIETVEMGLAHYIQKTDLVSNAKDLETIRGLLFKYMDNSDVIRLHQIILQATEHSYQLKRLLDVSSKQSFLLLLNRDGKLAAIANLQPRGRSIKSIDNKTSIANQVIKFIEQGNAWMEAVFT